MFNLRSRSGFRLPVRLVLLAAIAACGPLAAQQVSVTTFIADVETAIQNLTASTVPGKEPLVFAGENMFAYGSLVDHWTPQVETEYVDGLKAAGVQRVDFNPGVTTIDDPAAVANLDAMVHHTRQLGMMLAIHPEYLVGELSVNTFQDFTAAALVTYPQLAARYRPDNFVIVHEPTTQTARMGISGSVAEWDAFIRAVEPLIKAASPRTRVGAGDCTNCSETAYFPDFAAIPTCTASNQAAGCLDFLTMDLYNDSAADFAQDVAWAALAHSTGKGVYMEETWAPHYLPAGINLGEYQGSPTGLEGASLVGSCDQVFETLDQDWLSALAQFDIANGLESITPFTTQAFFLYVSAAAPLDDASNHTYILEMAAALQAGQLTATASAYAGMAQQHGIKTVTSISNAGYATLPTIFNPTCGTADNPCNANSTVAPDMLVSAFGADLANQSIPASNFPTSLGGTTVTLVDSTNTSFRVPIYSVSPNQVNYLVPSDAAPGPAALTVTSGDGTVTSGSVLVAPVSPGLYTSFANGQGPAAAIAICTGVCSGWPNPLGNRQFWQYTFVPGCTSGTCTVPLDWGGQDTVVIELYGTGIRHRAALSDITAAIASGTGNTNAQVEYADKQGTDTGLDQVNVLIPQSLRGAGQVSLTLSGQYVEASTQVSYPFTSNAVILALQ
jgi:uncharacterized protein (TIGR03437 family)